MLTLAYCWICICLIGNRMPRLLEPKLLLPKERDVPTAMFPPSFPSVITTTLRHHTIEQKPSTYNTWARLKKGFWNSIADYTEPYFQSFPNRPYGRVYWMVYRGPVVGCGSYPTPSLPLQYRQQVVSHSQSSYLSPVEFTDVQGSERGWVRSHNSKKACSSINSSILSALQYPSQSKRIPLRETTRQDFKDSINKTHVNKIDNVKPFVAKYSCFRNPKFPKGIYTLTHILTPEWINVCPVRMCLGQLLRQCFLGVYITVGPWCFCLCTVCLLSTTCQHSLEDRLTIQEQHVYHQE